MCVIGPSGGGKSTFLRCINLLEVPTKGDILIEGVSAMQNMKQIDLLRQKVGMVFQQFNLFPHMTVMKNITLAPVRLKKMSPLEAEEKEMCIRDRSVVSHKEAHAQGYASNHGDPENWMGRFGMTMEDFRARVRAKLKGELTIMGKVVNRDELVAWIDAHAVEVEEQPEPEVKPEPVAIKAGDKVVFKSGVTQWGTGSGNKGIPSWAQDGKTTFTVLELSLIHI